MSAPVLDSLLRSFRWQMAATRAARAGVFILFVIAIVWASERPEPASRQSMFLFALAAIVGWMMILMNTVRATREVQASSILLATGQLDRAETWLRKIMTRFSLSVQAKIMAAQQLASLFFRKEAHQEVVTICRELLRYRMGRLRNVLVNTRLMLADSLLTLDRVGEAYEAMLPVYEGPLSLVERMKLLPVQLRYELAADHAGSAVQGLAEKVRIAELLDSPRAALVHALLAEACRREAMVPQSRFLAERARLYHDLEPLVARYAVIAPVAGLV